MGHYTIIKEAKASKNSLVFRNCQSIDEAISIIKNRVFKIGHTYDGDGVNFTAQTEHYTYYIKEQ